MKPRPSKSQSLESGPFLASSCKYLLDSWVSEPLLGQPTVPHLLFMLFFGGADDLGEWVQWLLESDRIEGKVRDTKVLQHKLVMSLNSPPGDIGRPWSMRPLHCAASRSHAPAVVIIWMELSGRSSVVSGSLALSDRIPVTVQASLVILPLLPLRP